MALIHPVRLVIDHLLLALLVHGKDPVLPFRVGAQDANTDVRGIPWGYPLSYGTHQDVSFRLVISSVGQLGFPLQLPEVNMCGVISHAHLSHPLLVDFFDGGVTELLAEEFGELIPSRIPVLGPLLIVVIFIRDVPVVSPEMHPPVLSGSFEMRGGENHHGGGESSVVLFEDVKVHLTVPKESVDVIMLPFERSEVLYQDQLDPCNGRGVVLVSWAKWSMGRGSIARWWS